jgi:hypothetical protein
VLADAWVSSEHQAKYSRVFGYSISITIVANSPRSLSRDIPGTSRHRRATSRRAELLDDPIEAIQHVKKLENCGVQHPVSNDQNSRAERKHVLLRASHSPWSTYFGSTTIVAKLPFTSWLVTNGLQRNSGFATARVFVGEFGMSPAAGRPPAPPLYPTAPPPLPLFCCWGNAGGCLPAPLRNRLHRTSMNKLIMVLRGN